MILRDSPASQCQPMDNQDFCGSEGNGPAVVCMAVGGWIWMFCGGANAAQYGVRPSTRVVDSPCSPFFTIIFFGPL